MTSRWPKRSTRKSTRYFSPDERNETDLNFTFSQNSDSSQSLLRDVVKKNAKKLGKPKQFIDTGSYFKQTTTCEEKAPLTRKVKTENKIDHGESDSSFVFTDDISDVSFNKNQDPPKKKRKNRFIENLEVEVRPKKPKRKDLSATRLATKKRKLDIKSEKNDEGNEHHLNLVVKSESQLDKIVRLPCKPDTISSVKIKQEKLSFDPTQISHVDIKQERLDQDTVQSNVKIKKEKLSIDSSETVKVKSEKETQVPKIKSENEIKQEKLEPPNKRVKLSTDIEWESSMLSELAEVDVFVSKNIIRLFNNECTIPFIARYRKEATSNMEADGLRYVKDVYEYIKDMQTKAKNILKQLEKSGNLTKELENSIHYARSIDELEYLYAPFKPGSVKSKAEKAKSLGLEEPAWMILNGTRMFNANEYIKSNEPGLATVDKVLQGVQHIIADIFSKDEDVLEFIRNAESRVPIQILSKKMRATNEKKQNAHGKKLAEDPCEKFRLYYEFQRDVRHLQPHQILALNRGEAKKVLSVKFQVADSFEHHLYNFCRKKWLTRGKHFDLRFQLFDTSFKDSFTRLITPLLIRRIKSKLNIKAQQTGIENFAQNLKNLLQTPPVKGCAILGIDPGIRHGVKFALISHTGEVLWTDILHFDLNDLSSYRNDLLMKNVKQKMTQYNCHLIALGNGTGCRPFEQMISDCLKIGYFQPELNVQYTIVNERGASIYSCSPIAKEEFSDLDPNMISAVFIARSLQDPLNEFVKVEPKHLGVGMYQHDMPEKQLNKALDEIVVECVSFTGADVNTASIHLLKRISGLSTSKAKNMIEWRKTNGSFKNRSQLMLVKGFGPKSFEQCSGFLRVHPRTCMSSSKVNIVKPSTSKKGLTVNDEMNPLDMTWIHPESYHVTYDFLKYCEVQLKNLGTQSFIDEVKEVVASVGLQRIAQSLNQSYVLIKLIYDALTRPLDYDYRSEFTKPMFKKGLTSIEDLTSGMIIRGRVGNVAAFGAFVDIGVGRDGLIHVSNMNRLEVKVGDQVEVKIVSVEVKTGRIGLLLLDKF